MLELAEDLLKRSNTCKGLEDKRVDMFPKEGTKMSKDAKDFLERLKKLRDTLTKLDDNINKEFEKYSGDDDSEAKLVKGQFEDQAPWAKRKAPSE